MKLANKIQLKLLEFARGHAYDIIIPNFYYDGFEMDVFKLTNSGYIHEYEIKISRADFRKDFKKEGRRFSGTVNNYKVIYSKKHDRMSEGKCKANRFWFVTPENLLKVEEIPDHAGLLEYDGSFLHVVKNAPLLHKNKVEEKIFRSLTRSLSFREQNLRSKINWITRERTARQNIEDELNLKSK